MELLNEINAEIYFEPRFNLESDQMENREVMFLEESILLNNLSLKYCGPGMIIFSHLISGNDEKELIKK